MNETPTTLHEPWHREVAMLGNNRPLRSGAGRRGLVVSQARPS